VMFKNEVKISVGRITQSPSHQHELGVETEVIVKSFSSVPEILEFLFDVRKFNPSEVGSLYEIQGLSIDRQLLLAILKEM